MPLKTLGKACISLAALLLCASAVLAAPAQAVPASTVDTLQDYRLDQIEKQLDKMETRIEELPGKWGQNLKNDADTMRLWVGTERTMLSSFISKLSIGLTVSGLIITVMLGLITLYFSRKQKRFEDELEAKLKNVQEIAASCASMHKEIEQQRDAVNAMAQDLTPDKVFSAKELNELTAVAEDKSAPILDRQKAKALLAEADKDWATALDYWKIIVREEPTDDTHFRLGVAAGNLSRTDRNQAAVLVPLAATHFHLATELNPKHSLAFCNWGTALTDMAGASNDPTEKLRLLSEACTKLEQATRIDADYAAAFYNWGNALVEMGHASDEPKEKTHNFSDACAKYKQATKIDPDFAAAFSNWGNALAEMGHASDEPKEQCRFLSEACAKFEQATMIDTNYAAAFSNWGNALVEMGHASDEPKEKWRFLSEACAKFEQATMIDTNYAAAFYNWGASLLNKARLTSGPEQKDLLMLANEQCVKAEALSPGKGAYNLACIAALQGNAEECCKWLNTSIEHNFMPPCAHLRKDNGLDSIRETDWFQDILKKVCTE